MIRKFYLVNSKGQEFHFKYSSGILFSDVNGLGFSFDLKYLKFDHVYETIKQDVSINEISGVLSFLSGYEGYQKLINYLSIETINLKLYYTSYDTKYVYVDVLSLTKGEIKDGYLKSEIVFNKKSYWIKERSLILDFGEIIGGKNYAYKYPYSYLITRAGKTRITVEGIKEASTVIEIIGDVDKPELTVFKDEEILTNLKLNITKNNARIIISSIPNNQYMVSVNDNETIDIYNEQDFEKDNFILLAPGELLLEFKSGKSTLTTCKLTIYEYHLG